MLKIVLMCCGAFAFGSAENSSMKSDEVVSVNKAKECEVKNCCDIKFDEISFFEENIAFSNKSGIFLYKSGEKLKHLVVEDLKLAHKICLGSDKIFINTIDGVFKAIDFDGNLIFSVTLDKSVSRSDIVFDKKTGNILFFTVDNVVFCYSSNGKLLWKNTDFINRNPVLSGKIVVNEFVYFLNNFGFYFLDKKTGEVIPNEGLNHVVENDNFYDFSESGDKIWIKSYKNDCVVDKITKKVEKLEKDEFLVNGKKFSKKSANLNGKKIDDFNVACFNDCSILFKKDCLIVFKNDKSELYKLNFDVKNVYFDGALLYFHDGSSAKIVNLVK